MYNLQSTKTKQITYTLTDCLQCGKVIKNTNAKRGRKRLYCDDNCKSLHHYYLTLRVITDKAIDKIISDNPNMSIEQFLSLLPDTTVINLAEKLGLKYKGKDWE